MKSTCKVDGTYGVEIGEFAIALEDGLVVYKPLPDSERKMEVVPDDSGEVDVTPEQEEWANNINEQLEGITKFAAELDIPTSQVSTALEDEEEEQA